MTLEVNTLDCCEFDFRLNDGTLYKIICTRDDMDKLIKMIDEKNVADCEEL
jgi:hypothetical protein